VAEKREAHPTYKGNRGYMPMVGHLAENGLVVHEEFRKGNEAPASRNLEFIKVCVANMPKGKRIARLRADAATYQATVINYCERKGIRYAIGAKQDAAVKAVIATIPETDWQPYRDGEIASTASRSSSWALAWSACPAVSLQPTLCSSASGCWHTTCL
jgi:hypothetical protein